MPRVELLLLGRPSISLVGGQIAGLTLAKAQALLYYLALEPGHTASREALATLLWPEHSAAAARANLRQILAQLKYVLPAVDAHGPPVLATSEAVQLNPAYELKLDVYVFENHLGRVASHNHPDSRRCAVCARRRRRALELYRGPLLDQLIVHDSPAFDEWVNQRRETLHEAALHALDELAAYYIERGALRDAASTLERLLALDPWREDACRQLMLVLVAGGRRSAALRQYQRCAAALLAELGAEPEDETTALYRRISAGDVAELAPALLAPDTRFPTNLPSPTTSFVGREAEVRTVGEQLLEGGERLLTITGPPGIGKSRLALAVGHALRTEFDDGVWWVPLVEVREPGMLIAEVLRCLDVSEGADEPHLATLQRYLRDKLLLLILDNCEQLEPAAPQLALLLEACPNLVILATSRVPLRIRGEHTYTVPALEMPAAGARLRPEQLERYDAIRLFLARAQALRSDIELNAATGAAIVAICRRLDGLALGIELAAARVTLFSLPELEAQLSRSLDLLVGGARDLPRHQQTMRSAITWSYELLQPSEQQLFRRLGIFAGGWTIAAAQEICAGADGEPAVLDALQALLDHSLVQRGPDAHETRFSMLEMVREYALEQLSAVDEVERVHRRHSACFVALAAEAAPQLKGAEQRRWLNRLEAEHDNLRLALSWDFGAGRPQEATRLVADLWWFWRLRGYFGEGRGWVERALAAAPADLGDDATAGRTELLLAAGFFAWDAGERGTARRYFEEAQALVGSATAGHAQRPQQLAQAADALYGLGMLDVFDGGAEAQARLDRALALYGSLNNRWGAARVLQRLTRLAVDCGQVAEAEGYAGESLSLARQTANPWLIAWSQMALGNFLAQHGDAGRGAVSFEEAALLFGACSDRAGVAHARFGQAQAAFAQGSYEAATVLLIEARQTFGELGLEEHVAIAQVFLGYAALFQGDVERARDQLNGSLQLCLALGHGEGISSSLIGLGWVALLEGKPERAAELLGSEQALREDSGARLRPLTHTVYDRVYAELHAASGAAAVATAWKRGRALPGETALAPAACALLPAGSANELSQRRKRAKN